jgi:hypothetical protein
MVLFLWIYITGSIENSNYFSATKDLIITSITTREGIFKLLRNPGINYKESIPPAYVAWRAGTTTLFLLGS